MDTKAAVEYILKNNIEGDFVETGVLAGLQEIIMGNTLNSYNINNRKIHLFDTFEGLVEPTDKDYSLIFAQETAEYNKEVYEKTKNKNGGSDRCYCSLEDVKKNLRNKTSYPFKNFKFIKGDILKTLEEEKNIPEKIALLRLDCDWYEPSKFALEKLYSKVVPNGVIIFDDYNIWNGQREATDEFFKENNLKYNIVTIKTSKKYKGINKSASIIKKIV